MGDEQPKNTPKQATELQEQEEVVESTNEEESEQQEEIEVKPKSTKKK